MEIENKLAERGGELLARYRHPGDWAEGNSTGKIHLIGQKILRVEEIRIGGMAFVSEETALANADAIRAWAGSVGLQPFQFMLDQQRDKAPYVMVPQQYFEVPVLPLLQALPKPESPE
jgi:hypothetical protein